MIEASGPRDIVCVAKGKTFRVVGQAGSELISRVPCRVADIPPGVYKVGRIIEANEVDRDQVLREYGSYFCDILLLEEPDGFKGRSGLGIHGGSELGPVGPNNPAQEWPNVKGVKLQDSDLNRKAVPLIRASQMNGGTVYLEILE